MFLSEWRQFPSAPCLAGKKNLMTARVSMLLNSRASLTCFQACFLPGRAKDLSAPRVRATRFNIQKFYMVLALRWVFCTDLRTDSDLCFIHHRLVFITVVESVYSAVRTDSLYKADYVSPLKGKIIPRKIPTVLEANKKCWRLETRCMHFHSKATYKHGRKLVLDSPRNMYTEVSVAKWSTGRLPLPLPLPLGEHRWILLSRCKSQSGNVRVSDTRLLWNCLSQWCKITNVEYRFLYRFLVCFVAVYFLWTRSNNVFSSSTH